MKRGDIYLVPGGPKRGRMQQGQQLVLILSPARFNKATKLPVVLPITSGDEFTRRIGFAVPLLDTESSGVVRCDQPRVLDILAREGRKVDALPPGILDEVLARVGTLFE